MAYAMRLPRPDLMKPPESQKAIAISHLRMMLVDHDIPKTHLNCIRSVEGLRDFAGEGTECRSKREHLGQHGCSEAKHGHSPQR